MDDELTPGVDRPRRGQYLILMLIITLLAIAGYFYRRSGDPLPGPGMEAPTSSSYRVTDGVPGNRKCV